MNLNSLAFAAAVAYLAAAGVLWRTLAARVPGPPLAGLGIGVAACALHAAALAGAIHAPDGFALDLARTGSLLAWEAATLTLIATLRLPVASLGFVTLPVGAVGAGLDRKSVV